MKKIPIKVDFPPLLESIFELRFEPICKPDLVFSLLYSGLKDHFPTVDSLPIFQVPEQIRLNDPNLKYQPYYRLRHKDNENFVIQIGPQVVAFSINPQNYKWNTFSSYAKVLTNLNLRSNKI